MKQKINISVNTDLNEIIKSINGDIGKNVLPTFLNEETLMFVQTVYEKLPYPFNQLPDVVESPQKRDLAFLTIITILGSILKKYNVRYREKIEGCQLFTYVLGNSSSGKNVVSNWGKVGDEYHTFKIDTYKTKIQVYNTEYVNWEEGNELEEPQKPKRDYLFLAANTTKAALVDELNENGGFGLLFATEADTITSASQSEHGRFTDIMRNAFHGENYRVNRKGFTDGPIEIPKVRFGILLTSTLDQCFKFIPNYENGMYQRFMFYLMSADINFTPELTTNNYVKQDELIESVAKLFLKIGNNEVDAVFNFTDEQKNRRDKFIADIDTSLLNTNGNRLQGNVFRSGLIFTRLCMLVSYLREFENGGIDSNKTIGCTDNDFDCVKLIVFKLINHLQILDFYYENKNPKQRVMANFSNEEHFSNNQNKLEIKREAVRLIQTGLSYADVAKILLGDEKKKGTIWKWVNELTKGGGGVSFPFPETETPSNINGSIDVENVLNETEVSLFDNIKTSVANEYTYTLHELITTDTFKHEIFKLRQESDDSKRKILKRGIMAFTPSGYFKVKRSKNTLIKHSGFICIDIDQKGNEDILNFENLKEEFKKISNVAFCSHSVSGKGYYLLIPIESPENHEIYFDSIYQAFKSLGIQIDKSCRDVSRLRIISFDENSFMAKKALKIHQVLRDNSMEIEFIKPNFIHTNADFEKLVAYLDYSKKDITDNPDDWVAIAYAVANTFGEKGRAHFHSISNKYPDYDVSEADYKYSYCLNKGRKVGKRYSLKKLFEIAEEQGVEWQSFKVS